MNSISLRKKRIDVKNISVTLHRRGKYCRTCDELKITELNKDGRRHAGLFDVDVGLGRESGEEAVALSFGPAAGDSVADDFSDPHAGVGDEGKDDEFGLVRVTSETPGRKAGGSGESSPDKVVGQNLLAHGFLSSKTQQRRGVGRLGIELATEDGAFVVLVHFRVPEMPHRESACESDFLPEPESTFAHLVFLFYNGDV